VALNQEIADFTATELRRLVARRELSPVEVVESCLGRVEQYNGVINAVVTLSERALDDARQLEEKLGRRHDPGPLCGLPTGIKDVTPVAGLRTTYGSPLYADHVSTEDALVVQRLRNADAIILGKTNCPEFAAGGNTFNEVFGRTRNPWDPGRSAGGSTGGGAAALASGMIALAEGTDLGGSLRIPASFCGVVGLRPSVGLVPTHPTDYLWDNLLVTGPMARTAEDAALMLQVIAGPSPLAPMHQQTANRDFVRAVEHGPVAGLRIGYAPDIAGIGVEAEIEQICRRTVAELAHGGARVDVVQLDLAYASDAFLALRGLWMVAHQYTRLDKMDQFGQNVAGNVSTGLSVTTRELGAAEHVRGRVWRFFQGFFQKYDHLLTPSMAVPPFPVEQDFPESVAGRPMKTYVDWMAPTFILSLTGLPIGSVPCGIDSGGLPVGLQIVGRPFGEEAVLALAKRVQEIQPMGGPSLANLDRWEEGPP
jgi:amidase